MSGSSTLEKEARRRLGLITPETAVKVLSRDIYWTVPFLQLYLDRCSLVGVEEPQRALLMAAHAPDLTRRIGFGSRPGEYKTVKDKNSYLVRAFSVLGSLNRRCGNITEARGCYAYALELMEGEGADDYARAELLRRHGLLQSATDEETGLDTLNEAISLFVKIGHRNDLALTLIARASLYCRQNKWSLSAEDLQRACLSADERTAMGKKALHAALINLCFALANGGLPLGEQSDMLTCIRALRSRLGQQRFSNTKAKLSWMEGLLHRNLGFTRQSERVLERARQAFIKLGDPYDFVLVTIDLAQVLLLDGEREKYEQLQQSTIAALCQMTAPEDLQEALTQWQRLPYSETVLMKIMKQVKNLV